MLPPLLWLHQGLLVELLIRSHYWLSRIKGRPHTLFGPLLGIIGPPRFLWHVNWMNRSFGPSMGLPPAFVLIYPPLLWTLQQSWPMLNPWAVLYVELIQLIALNTNRSVASRLFIVFCRGLSIWTTMVCVWIYSLTLHATVIRAIANFSMGGYLSSTPLSVRLM